MSLGGYIRNAAFYVVLIVLLLCHFAYLLFWSLSDATFHIHCFLSFSRLSLGARGLSAIGNGPDSRGSIVPYGTKPHVYNIYPVWGGGLLAFDP